MYDLLKILVAQLLMPLPVLLSLLLLGLLLVKAGRRRLGLAMSVAALMLLLLLSWAPVADRLISPLETQYEALHDLPVEADLAAIVVLGGGWHDDAPWPITAKLNESSAIRLMEGVRLWRQRPALPLVVTGASRDPEREPVARGYAEAARQLGVPSARLQVLDTPTDTGLEARAVRESLGEGAQVVLVTSASHMSRAIQHFRRAGLKPLAAPTHYLAERALTNSLGYWVPSATQLRKSERAIYERLGQLAVYLE